MPSKTNSMRLLEARRLPYRACEFPADIHSAEGVAQALGVPAGQVFKTLVVVRERGRPLLVMLPGGTVLDLKLLAQAAGEKSLRMATHKEAEAITGLEVGGISPLSLLAKGFEVYAEEVVLSLPEVYVSAGCRGLNLCLHPSDLLQVTKARTARVAKPENRGEEET